MPSIARSREAQGAVDVCTALRGGDHQASKRGRGLSSLSDFGFTTLCAISDPPLQYGCGIGAFDGPKTLTGSVSLASPLGIVIAASFLRFPRPGA